jgi:hypothetical protein
MDLERNTTAVPVVEGSSLLSEEEAVVTGGAGLDLERDEPIARRMRPRPVGQTKTTADTTNAQGRGPARPQAAAKKKKNYKRNSVYRQKQSTTKRQSIEQQRDRGQSVAVSSPITIAVPASAAPRETQEKTDAASDGSMNTTEEDEFFDHWFPTGVALAIDDEILPAVPDSVECLVDVDAAFGGLSDTEDYDTALDGLLNRFLADESSNDRLIIDVTHDLDHPTTAVPDSVERLDVDSGVLSDDGFVDGLNGVEGSVQ